MARRKRLGEILSEKGHLTDAQLEEVLGIRSKPGENRMLG